MEKRGEKFVLGISTAFIAGFYMHITETLNLQCIEKTQRARKMEKLCAVTR